MCKHIQMRAMAWNWTPTGLVLATMEWRIWNHLNSSSVRSYSISDVIYAGTYRWATSRPNALHTMCAIGPIFAQPTLTIAITCLNTPFGLKTSLKIIFQYHHAMFYVKLPFITLPRAFIQLPTLTPFLNYQALTLASSWVLSSPHLRDTRHLFNLPPTQHLPLTTLLCTDELTDAWD